MFLFQILLQSSWQTFAIHKHPNKTYNEVHSRQCGTLKLKAILKLDLYDLNNLHMYKNTETSIILYLNRYASVILIISLRL